MSALTPEQRAEEFRAASQAFFASIKRWTAETSQQFDPRGGAA